MNRSSAVQAVTMSRIFLAAVVAALTYWHAEPYNWTLWVSLVLLGFAEFSDLLDGYLARKWRVVTEFGKMFDPFCDSVARLVVYWALAMLGRAWLSVFVVLASRDILVSYIRLVLASAGADVSAKLTGKLKAWVHGLGGFVLMAGPLYWTASSKEIIVGITSTLVIIATAAALLHHLLSAWPYIKGKSAPA